MTHKPILPGLLSGLTVAVASLTFFAQPVVGSLLGWMFLKETITLLFLFGGVLIAIGLIVSSTE